MEIMDCTSKKDDVEIHIELKTDSEIPEVTLPEITDDMDVETARKWAKSDIRDFSKLDEEQKKAYLDRIDKANSAKEVKAILDEAKNLNDSVKAKLKSDSEIPVEELPELPKDEICKIVDLKGKNPFIMTINGKVVPDTNVVVKGSKVFITGYSEDFVLDGTGKNNETETVGFKSNKGTVNAELKINPEYKDLLKPGMKIGLQLITEAKQHRNTKDASWEVLSTEEITALQETRKVVPKNVRGPKGK